MIRHRKVLWLAAAVAAVSAVSPSGADAATAKDRQRKNFFEFLATSDAAVLPVVLAPATPVTPRATAVSAASVRPLIGGVTAQTARPPGTTLREYRIAVFQNLVLNRQLYLAKLRILRFELRAGVINRAQFFALRTQALGTFRFQRAELLIEFRTGIPQISVIR